MRTLNFWRLFWELRRISLAINCLRYMNATFQQVFLFVLIVYPPNANFFFTHIPYHYFYQHFGLWQVVCDKINGFLTKNTTYYYIIHYEYLYL